MYIFLQKLRTIHLEKLAAIQLVNKFSFVKPVGTLP